MTGSDDSLELSLPWGRTPPATRPARTGDEPKPPQPPPAVEEAEQPHRPAPAGGPESGDLELGLGRLEASMLARLQRLEEKAAAREARRADRLDRLEQELAAREAGLQARFDELERVLEANRAASAESVGLLAGHLVARLEDQAVALEAARMAQQADLEAKAQARHDKVLARIDEVSRATIDATGELASRHLVTQLLEGIVVTGEVLEAEMIDLRRMVEEYARRPPSPPDDPAPVGVETTVESVGRAEKEASTVESVGSAESGPSTVESVGSVESEPSA